MNLLPPTPDWRVFKLLWQAARRRSAGRRKRQREIMHRKKGKSGDSLGGLAFMFFILVMTFVHGALGWMLVSTEQTARTVAVEMSGRLVIPDYMDDALDRLAKTADSPGGNGLEDAVESFAERLDFSRSQEMGGTEKSQRQLVVDHFHQYGVAGFVTESAVVVDSSEPPTVWWPVAGFVFLWWLVMIVCQGEGLELDIQRRRHPMWEWVQSHPVRPVTAFAADLLAPMMANPVYFTAPVFWWFVLGSRFGIWPGFVGGLVVGLVFSVAASSLNKAIEISAMLRLAPRNRGALLGFVSWLGYAAMMLPLFTLNSPALKAFLVKSLAPLAGWLPLWPARALTFGWAGGAVWWQAAISGMALAGLLAAGAIALAWWAANRGLQAGGAANKPGRVRIAGAGGRSPFSRNPLQRKELLWFWRDKGAVVQAVLIPLTIAGFQVFNLRGLLNSAIGSWNGVCGAAILCGTYFLLVLGPRSLASEGGALWIATTWPQGMEDLLKAKARLWWVFSNVIVGGILLAAGVMFPRDGWRIALVAVGWYFFGHSLAEKTVTLATAPSSSGEPEPAPKGRQWAAMLGTLAFSSGVISGAWSLAVTGVVFSSLTAAAMWQNFRARLPFLFDPWSEKLPPAPTLMHAMIGIAAMVEVVALTGGIAAGVWGMEKFWLTRALAYGIVGAVAWIMMHRFLAGRGVSAESIWRWQGKKPWPETAAAWATAGVIGAALAGAAMLYLTALRHLPITSGYMGELANAAAGHDAQRIWIFIMAVGMAPFAEEYFFRGLLFRALDREWGGRRAILTSAAYFAIYHPPVSWLPVFALGICSAWSFRKSGLLGPSVLIHMIYNAIVVGLG